MLLLKNIYYLLMLTGFIILLIRWKKLDSSLHIYLAILGCGIITEQIHDRLYPQPISTYIYHIYQPVEMILLSIYYFSLFQKRAGKRAVIVGIILFIAFFGYKYFYEINNFYAYNRADLMIENVLITIFSVMYLLELYQLDHSVVLTRSPHFWVVFANLVFSSGSMLFNGYTYYLLTYKIPEYEMLSFILIALNYFLYLFYIIGFLCREKAEIS